MPTRVINVPHTSGGPGLSDDDVIAIQEKLTHMESLGCECIGISGLSGDDYGRGSTLLLFKCPAGGAGSSGGARTRSNRKSRRSRTRKN